MGTCESWRIPAPATIGVTLVAIAETCTETSVASDAEPDHTPREIQTRVHDSRVAARHCPRHNDVERSRTAGVFLLQIPAYSFAHLWRDANHPSSSRKGDACFRCQMGFSLQGDPPAPKWFEPVPLRSPSLDLQLCRNSTKSRSLSRVLRIRECLSSLPTGRRRIVLSKSFSGQPDAIFDRVPARARSIRNSW